MKEIMEIHSQDEYEKNIEFNGVFIVKCDYIILRGNSRAKLLNNSRAKLLNNSSAELLDNSSAELLDNSSAELLDNSRAVLRGNSRAELWDNSNAELLDNSRAELLNNSSAVLWDHSYCLVCNVNNVVNNVKSFGNSVVNRVQELNYNKSVLTACETIDDKIVLYKSVNPKTNADYYTGKVIYDIGKDVICSDWDSNRNRQCGGGLHLCMTPLMTQCYNKGKILKCIVDKKDILVYPKDASKIRCRKVTPIAVVDIQGNEIKESVRSRL